MTRLLVLLALVLAAFPSGATACVRLPVREQTAAELRHWSRVQTKLLQREAAKRLASGQVAVADELAELLVPNIRPVRLIVSSCGPEGELDFAGGLEGSPDHLFDDPRLKGINRAEHVRVLREYDGSGILGPACNAEFRKRFATFLRAELAEADLKAAWLYLAARKRDRDMFGSVYARLVVFAGHTRRPPTQWWSNDRWIAKDIERFTRKADVGRRLVAAMAMFWARQERMLDSDESVCPGTLEIARNAREEVIGMILREQDARMQRKIQSPVAPPN